MYKIPRYYMSSYGSKENLNDPSILRHLAATTMLYNITVQMILMM